MDPIPVIAVDDVASIAFEKLRPGCEKGLLHQDAPAQTGAFRVQPGSGIPPHRHSRVHDLFIGVKGLLEIRYEGEHGSGLFVLKPGAFCRVPPGVRHEVMNPSKTDEALFVLVHAPYEGFDILPEPFE